MRRLRAAAGRPRHLVLAVGGGLLVALSTPPWGFWPLAFVGVVLLEVAVDAAPDRTRRALAGALFGAGWMYLGLAWMWFLTVPGYLVAAGLFAALHGAAAAVAPTGPWATVGRPAAHTIAEVVRLTVPFGGVPLASLGISQAAGPLLGLARLGGVTLLTWVVFQLGASVAAAVRDARGRDRSGSRRWATVPPAAVVLLIVFAAVAPAGRDTGDRLTVAAVQGGGEQGTRALDVPSRVVTERHLAATATIDPSAPRPI